MARNDGKPENQHYVPRLLLRNFAIDPNVDIKKQQIWVFDKSNDNVFSPNIGGIAAETSFYDVEGEKGIISAETALSKLEDKAAPVIQRIIAGKSVNCLSDEDRTWLSIFCTVQFVRVPDSRARQLSLHNALVEKARQLQGDEAADAIDIFKDDAAAKAMAVATMFSSIKEFEPMFAAKCAFLFEAPDAAPFLIGDNPIALHNDRTFGPYGNLGLAVPGIQIFLPISPKFTLAMWDFSFLDDQCDLLNRALRSGRTKAQTAELSSLLHAARVGGCQAMDADQVTRLNSYQIRSASRFVLSSHNDFALVRRMIADNGKYRKGLRLTLD